MGGYQSLMLVLVEGFHFNNWNKLQIHFYTFEWGLFESVVFFNFLEEKIYHPFSKLCIPIVPSCH